MKKFLTALLVLVILGSIPSCAANSADAPNASAEIAVVNDQVTEDVLMVYREFLQGKRSAKSNNGAVHIDDIFCFDSEKARQHNEYALYDMNGDGVPELHVRSSYYFIYTYQNNELVQWYSGTTYSFPLVNKAILSKRPGSAPAHISYLYSVIDFYGAEVLSISFDKGDIDGDGNYDQTDDYIFERIKLPKADWDVLTEKYLSVKPVPIAWFVYAEDQPDDVFKDTALANGAGDDLSYWVGQYHFFEFLPPNMNMVYHLNICYENDGYWADLDKDGWMSMARFKAKVQGNSDRIDIVFDQYNPENIRPYVNLQTGDILFSLEIQDEEIITNWNKISTLKPENMSAQVCFTKDVDIKQFLQEFDEQQIEENLKRLYFLMTEWWSVGELVIGQGYPEAEKQKFSEEKIEIDHNLTFIANKRYKLSEIMVVQPAYLAEEYNVTTAQTSKFGEDILLLSYGTEGAGFSLWLTKNEEVFLWLHDESYEQTGLYALQPVISEMWKD